jgi:disulfide bond formation protein DsbB
MSLVRFVLRWWPAFALLACLALLGTAIFVFEMWLGYPPCELCLKQRVIYFETAAAAVLSLIWGFARNQRGAGRQAAQAIVLIGGCAVLVGLLVETLTTILVQPMWLAVAAAVVAFGVLWGLLRTDRLMAFLIFFGFASQTWMATFHAGVELKWWPGPAHCTGGGRHIDVEQIQKLFSGVPVHAAMCDVALWHFMGVSMAGWNAVAAAILTLVSLAAFLQAGASRGR